MITPEEGDGRNREKTRKLNLGQSVKRELSLVRSLIMRVAMKRRLHPSEDLILWRTN